MGLIPTLPMGRSMLTGAAVRAVGRRWRRRRSPEGSAVVAPAIIDPRLCQCTRQLRDPNGPSRSAFYRVDMLLRRLCHDVDHRRSQSRLGSMTTKIVRARTARLPGTCLSALRAVRTATAHEERCGEQLYAQSSKAKNEPHMLCAHYYRLGGSLKSSRATFGHFRQETRLDEFQIPTYLWAATLVIGARTWLVITRLTRKLSSK